VQISVGAVIRRVAVGRLVLELFSVCHEFFITWIPGHNLALETSGRARRKDRCPTDVRQFYNIDNERLTLFTADDNTTAFECFIRARLLPMSRSMMAGSARKSC
jgi:hypothetical protein